jgi:isocitrate lyase
MESNYQETMKYYSKILAEKPTWNAINAESIARMKAQNSFKTGLDIARHNADIMRKDMAEYEADPSKYTQSLGCWHGFVAQQTMISVKKHFGTTNKRYLYLSGWMVAAMRSQFGPLPDQVLTLFLLAACSATRFHGKKSLGGDREIIFRYNP